MFDIVLEDGYYWFKAKISEDYFLARVETDRRNKQNVFWFGGSVNSLQEVMKICDVYERINEPCSI